MTQFFIGGSKKKPKTSMRNLCDFENDIVGLRSVINDRIMEMAKNGTDISELPLGVTDPPLPNINLAELMQSTDEKQVNQKTIDMLSSLMQAEESKGKALESMK